MEPYRIQATIIPTNEPGQNTAKFVVSSLGIHAMGRANDELTCIGNYLRVQRAWCEEVSGAGGNLEDYFKTKVQTKYRSVEDLGVELELVEGSDLAKLCDVNLLRDQNSYLPGDTIVEFYRVVLKK